MMLFLDRNKTLLPRVDNIYLLTRVMILTGIGWYAFAGEYPQQDAYLFYLIIGTFLMHLAVFYAAIQGRFDIKLAYLSAIIYDILLVPTLILYTGRLHSPFYLLFFCNSQMNGRPITSIYNGASVHVIHTLDIVRMP